jgi:hypothetical protein
MKRGIKYLLCAILVYVLVLSVYLLSPPAEKTSEKIPNSLTGAAVIGFEVLPLCFIPLEQGWNLISFCANLTNKSVENALSQINNSYRYVMQWNASNASNQQFMIYSPLSSSNSFTKFNENFSYFIYFEESNNTNLYCHGNNFNDLNLSQLFGWNTPTYPYEFTANITKYLSTLGGKYRYLMKWNVSSQQFMIYSPLSSLRPFETIMSGEGQFINIKDSGGAYLFYNRTDLQ